jgi:hypothetical protein
MLGPWGPPPMMYPPCPLWAGWYGPWAPPLMHFHPGLSGPAEGFGNECSTQEMPIMRTSATSRTGKSDSLECQTRPSGFLEGSSSSLSPAQVSGVKHGQGARHRSMTKQSPTWRRV